MQVCKAVGPVGRTSVQACEAGGSSIGRTGVPVCGAAHAHLSPWCMCRERAFLCTGGRQLGDTAEQLSTRKIMTAVRPLDPHLTNRFMKYARLYWYIGSMAASSATQKNSTLASLAMGWYPVRALSMAISVFSASWWMEAGRRF